MSFSDSLWARINRSRTNVGPRIHDPEENESADSKINFLFYFDLVGSGPGSRPNCTPILSGAQTKFEHQWDVITFQPYYSYATTSTSSTSLLALRRLALSCRLLFLQASCGIAGSSSCIHTGSSSSCATQALSFITLIPGTTPSHP